METRGSEEQILEVTIFHLFEQHPSVHAVTVHIYDAVTFSSLSSSGNQIISGGNIPTTWYGTNELLRHFLRSFSSPDDNKTEKNIITTTITEDDVKKGFGKWREMTSTSPVRSTPGTLQLHYSGQCPTSRVSLKVPGHHITTRHTYCEVAQRHKCDARERLRSPVHKSLPYYPSFRGALHFLS
jgi:hypothetical protein